MNNAERGREAVARCLNVLSRLPASGVSPAASDELAWVVEDVARGCRASGFDDTDLIGEVLIPAEAELSARYSRETGLRLYALLLMAFAAEVLPRGRHPAAG